MGKIFTHTKNFCSCTKKPNFTSDIYKEKKPSIKTTFHLPSHSADQTFRAELEIFKMGLHPPLPVCKLEGLVHMYCTGHGTTEPEKPKSASLTPSLNLHFPAAVLGTKPPTQGALFLPKR